MDETSKKPNDPSRPDQGSTKTGADRGTGGGSEQERSPMGDRSQADGTRKDPNESGTSRTDRPDKERPAT